MDSAYCENEPRGRHHRILNLDTQRLDRAAELDRLRRNITILFTDIKGSTAYFERFGVSEAGR